MQNTEVKPKRKRIVNDPMRRVEKVEINSRNMHYQPNAQQNKVKNWIAMFSETFFEGRLITNEARQMLKEAREYGFEIPLNIQHIR
jgi:predicted ABC-type ATPase